MDNGFIKTYKFVKPKLFYYSFGVLLMTLIMAFLDVIKAYTLKNIMNSLIDKKIQLFYNSIYLFIFAIVLTLIFAPIFKWWFISSSEFIAKNIKKTVFEHILTLSLNYFDKNHSGEILSRLTTDIFQMVSIFQYKTRRFLAPLIKGIVSAVAMIVLDWRIGILLILYNILLTLINISFLKPIKRNSTNIQKLLGKLSSIYIDILKGFSELKLFNAEPFINKKINLTNSDLINFKMKNRKLEGYLNSINFFLMILSSLGMIIISIFFVKSNIITLGTIIAFLNLQSNLNKSLLNASEYFPLLQQSIAGSDRVLEILNEKSDEKIINKIFKTKNSDEVILKNIYFKYNNNDNNVLNKISLTIKQGEKIGIVGVSGSGKSTILKLLMKFYLMQKGEIFIKGKSIKSFKVDELQKLFAYVPQETFLFDDTIERNISIGNLNATKKEIEKAAQLAYAHDFIKRQINGYQTQVGEKGAKLSGGQKQRICIARAILKNAPILLLDEATSSLDSKSELEVQKALNNVMKNRTTIIVSHRFSTIKDLDRIYIIDKGQIIEDGNHMELLLKNGLYKTLFEKQFLL